MRLRGYWSRILAEPERKLATSHKKCLAVVWSVLLLRSYLKGSSFTVRTDHDVGKWLLKITEAAGRLARWRLRLWEFDFKVVHHAGIKHQTTDIASILKTGGGDTKTPEDEIRGTAIFDQDTQDMCLKDDSEEEDPDSQWQTTKKVCPYVLAILEVTEVNKEHSPKLQQLLEAQGEDHECRPTLNIFDKPQNYLTIDTNAYFYALHH